MEELKKEKIKIVLIEGDVKKKGKKKRKKRKLRKKNRTSVTVNVNPDDTVIWSDDTGRLIMGPPRFNRISKATCDFESTIDKWSMF